MQRPPTAFPIHQEELTRQRPKTPKPLGGTEPDEIETILSFPISKPVTPLYMERKYEAGTYEVPSWQRELKDPNPERHELRKIGQKTRIKDDNSIIEPRVDYNNDCELIRSGLATKENGKFYVNNRVYGHHHGGLYPIEGDGIHKLSKNEFKAFKMFKEFGVNSFSERIAKKQKDVEVKDVDFARELYEELQDKYPGEKNGI